MRRAIIGILLASTLVTPALAQSWQDRRGDQPGQGELRHDRREVRDDRQEIRQDQREVRGDARRGDYAEARRDRRDLRDDRQDFRGDRRDLGADRRDAAFRGNDRRDNRWDNRGNFDRGSWNNAWRNDRRYNWQGYRNANRGAYRLGRYYAPRGYSYRRWSPGYRVDPFFYGERYWISDPWAYRLPPAYGPYRWVRYYDDVALIDIRSGLVIDLIDSFFW